MIDEKEVVAKLLEIEDDKIKEACDIIRKSTRDIRSYLAHIVASVCDVDVEQMLKESHDVNIIHARWLFWYAYRYLTQESHKTIADRYKYIRRFATSGVGIAIANMTQMISQEPTWTKRWNIVKKVVKTTQNSFDFDENQKDVEIVLTAPKGVKVKVKQE